MKKLFTLLLACMLVMTLAVTVSANSNNGYTYSAPYGIPTVDGTVDNVWALAPWANIESRNISVSDGITAKFKVLHDDTYVYFLMQFTDDRVEGSENIKLYFHEDDCENGQACKDYSCHILQINASSWVYDLTAPVNPEQGGNGIHSVILQDFVVTNNGADYTYELSVKLHNGNVAAGVRMELVVEDYNTWLAPDNGWLGPHAWNTAAGNGNTPADYGMLYFLPDDGAEIPTGEVTEPAETEPVVTEPVETEPVETEPARTEPTETEPEVKDTEKEDEPATTAADGAEAPAASSFPVIPVVVAVVVVLAVIAAIVIAKKKKK